MFLLPNFRGVLERARKVDVAIVETVVVLVPATFFAEKFNHSIGIPLGHGESIDTMLVVKDCDVEGLAHVLSIETRLAEVKRKVPP